MTDVIKDRRDIDGNPVTLDRLCRLEPAWAASRIRVMEAELARLRELEAALRSQVACERGDADHFCALSGQQSEQIIEMEKELEALRQRASINEGAFDAQHHWHLVADQNEAAAKLARLRELERMRRSDAVTSLCWFLRWVIDEDERRALRERKLRDYGRRRCEIVIPPPEPCECHGDPWCEDDK